MVDICIVGFHAGGDIGLCQFVTGFSHAVDDIALAVISSNGHLGDLSLVKPANEVPDPLHRIELTRVTRTILDLEACGEELDHFLVLVHG